MTQPGPPEMSAFTPQLRDDRTSTRPAPTRTAPRHGRNRLPTHPVGGLTRLTIALMDEPGRESADLQRRALRHDAATQLAHCEIEARDDLGRQLTLGPKPEDRAEDRVCLVFGCIELLAGFCVADRIQHRFDPLPRHIRAAIAAAAHPAEKACRDRAEPTGEEQAEIDVVVILLEPGAMLAVEVGA